MWGRWGVAVGVLAMLALAAPPAGASESKPENKPEFKPGQVVVVAGTGQEGYTGDGFAARDARIGERASVTVAPNGTVYLTDRAGRRVRVVSADGKINTLPGTVARRSPENDVDYGNGWIYSPSNIPQATAIGADGALYIVGGETVGRWQANGTITLLGGGGDRTFDDGGTGGDGGPATEARFSQPADIAVDAAGNVYVADMYDNRIRKIDPNGIITTVAGGGSRQPAQAEGGPATQLNLTEPASLAVDSAGNLYFTSFMAPLVGKVAPNGTFTTVVGGKQEGYSGDGGPASEAQVGARHGGVAVDQDDNLYVADVGNGQVRMITPAGTISTVGPATGDGDFAVGPDGDLYTVGKAIVHRYVRHAEPAEERQPVRGESRWADRAPGTVVTVAGTGREPTREPVATGLGSEPLPPGPSHVAVGPDGTVYYADPYRHQVGKVTEGGGTTVLAGTGDLSGESTGDGKPAKRVPLSRPSGVAVSPDGAVYFAESAGGSIREVSPDGIITTVPGIKVTGYPGLGMPQVMVDAAGNLVVSCPDDRLVRRMDPAGTVSAIAGGGDLWANQADGAPATAASIAQPEAVAVAGDGTVYFVDSYRSAVRAVSPDGIMRTAVGDSYRGKEEGGFAGDGGPATAAEINNPTGLAVGPDGSLYVADTFNNRIRRVTPNGVISTFAGTGEPAEKGDGGPAAKAALLEPEGIAVDKAGNLYVASAMGGSIRRIDPAGTITTVARFGDTADGAATATETAVNYPDGVAVDRAGTVYVTSLDGKTYAVGQDGTISRLEDVLGGDLATGVDGSLYSAPSGGITRRYPDGAMVDIAAGPVEEPFKSGQLARTAYLSANDIAAGVDGELYVADDSRVYRIDRDGVLEVVVKRGAHGLGVGPDGSLYLTDLEGHRVHRFSDGTLTTFAGTGSDAVYDGEDGDGGPAVEAVVRTPYDVAVAPDGTAYLSTSDGVHRVSTDGTINKILPDAQPDALALDAHGNLYFAESSRHRVRVLVRPGELEFPRFGWRTMWLGVNAAVAAWVGVVVVLLAYRHRQVTTARRAVLSGLPLPATGTSAR